MALHSHFTDIKKLRQPLIYGGSSPGWVRWEATREERDHRKVKRYFYEDQDSFLTCYLRDEKKRVPM